MRGTISAGRSPASRTSCQTDVAVQVFLLAGPTKNGKDEPLVLLST